MNWSANVGDYYMKLYKNSEAGLSDDILCMASMLGDDVKVPGKLPFSFYFSTNNSSHSIRVKPIFDPCRMSADLAGTLKLSDPWEYIPGKNDHNVDPKQIRKMKSFFRKYKVLFAAVWCGVIQETPVCDYFRGMKPLDVLMKDFDFYNEYKDDMDDIDSIEELEEFVRENSLLHLFEDRAL